MIKIAVYNRKGGTGKTAVSVNLAGVLEKKYGKKVLVTDCDTQMNASKYLLSNYQGIVRSTIVDFFNSGVSLQEVIYRCTIPAGMKKDGTPKESVETNIYIAPIVETSIHIESIDVLKRALDEIDKEYDYCIIDCPPSLSNEAMAGICAADYIIVPAQADDDSLGGYQLLVNTINQIRQGGYNLNLEILGVVMNNIAMHEAFDNYMYMLTHGGLKRDMFTTYIRRAAAVRKARHFGMPLCYILPNEKVTKDFYNLADEMITRISLRN